MKRGCNALVQVESRQLLRGERQQVLDWLVLKDEKQKKRDDLE